MKSKHACGLWVILLSSLFLLSFSSPSFGEDVTLTVPVSDAKKIVVELEKTQLYAQQIQLLEEANTQLVEQTKIFQSQVDVLKKTIDLQKEQIDLTVKQMDDQKKVYEDKIKVYEKEKPSFLDKVVIGVGGAGVGALIALGLVLLL